VGLSKAARRLLDAILIVGATALFTYIGFLLIAGVAHSGETQGAGRIVTGVVLLLPWFAVESAIHRLAPDSHDSAGVARLTMAVAAFAQLLYYLAIYWLARRLLSFLRRNSHT
jgi:hypothetical protein